MRTIQTWPLATLLTSGWCQLLHRSTYCTACRQLFEPRSAAAANKNEFAATCRSPPLQLEQALSGALGTRRTPAADIDALELLPGESISEFRVAARGTGEVLFDAYSTFAYTWLATRPAQRTIDAHGSDADAAARGGAEERVELLLGSGLTGAGYKGVPLQRYLLTQVALPFHWLYSRVILRAAAGQLQADSSSGKR